VTFSIVARSDDQKSWGVAVASKFLAVGAYVPAGEAGVGAIATQSYANLAFKSEGLVLLRSGKTAKETLELLVAGDVRREERQVGVVDATGGSATFTGSECMNWAGGVAGDGYAIQGNILAGPQVADEMEKAWLAKAGETSLVRRLVAALAAGDAVGGDRRGRQSAAVFVVSSKAGYGGTSDVLADLRSDDHLAPVTELSRLVDLHELYFMAPDPGDLMPLVDPLIAEVSALLSSVGFAPKGPEQASVRQALWDWAGVENLEMRVPEDPVIDAVVLRELKKHAGT
jgi:uncharacterized Ntn-hydrolase superfamily protein